MELREKAEELFLWAKSQHEYSAAWEAHSINTARAAEWIAAAVQKKQLQDGCEADKTLDPDKAYACGYLHDIGRYAGKQVGLEHPIIGYKLLMAHDMPTAAHVAMTHTYYGYDKINREDFWAEFDDPEMLKFTRGFMEKAHLSDYDRLIQLVDNMAHHSGIMTIENRFSDIIIRHDLKDCAAHLRELYALKAYFDKKAGINIYELFKDDIIRTTMDGAEGAPVRQVRKYHDQD